METMTLSDGNVTDWGELEGSFRGAIDIPRALRDAGYDVIGGES